MFKIHFWTVILAISSKFIFAASSNTTVSAPNLERDGRIVNGKAARIEEFPYTVHVTGYHHGDRTISCGGVIITSTIVISAAHCFYVSNATASTTHYQVRAGSSLSDQDGSVSRVKKISVHPVYRKNPIAHDLAVLLLECPLPLNGRTMRPIQLFECSEPIQDGTYGSVAGWGRLSKDGPFQNRLHSIMMKTVNVNRCLRVFKETYKDDWDQEIGNTQLCAVSAAGDGLRSFCKGDSGGPLVINDRLAGIMSAASPDCTSGCVPNIFTKISNYRLWIDYVIAEYNKTTTQKDVGKNYRNLPDDYNQYLS